MSAHDYNTIRRMKFREILSNPSNRQLLKQYALEFCSGPYQKSLLKLASNK